MSTALTVGIPFTYQLLAYGGTPPYAYSILSGLPAGLSLNASTGLISGTPTTPQSSTALVWQVEDSATPTPATATDSFLVVVQAVPVAVPFYQFVLAVAVGRLRGGRAVFNGSINAIEVAAGRLRGAVAAVPPVSLVQVAAGRLRGAGAIFDDGLLRAAAGRLRGAASSYNRNFFEVTAGRLRGATSEFVAGAVDLTTGLVAWYSLNETSGNRADSHTGSYTLTQAGTVGSTTGRVGNAANFANNNANRLSSSNSIFNRGDTDFYIAGWVRFTGVTSNEKTVLSKWNFDSTNRGYVLRYLNDQITWFVSADGTNNTNVSIAANVDTTYFLEVFHNAATNQIGIALNVGTFTTASHSGGIFNSSASFILGSFGNSTFASPNEGWVDELAMYSVVPDPGSPLRAALYNGGNGVAYPT
jgi:hypothetical protein